MHTFQSRETQDVAANLNANFAENAASAAANTALIKAVVLALHGEGLEDDPVLTPGAGLWCELTPETYWTSGEQHEMSAALTIALGASTTKYLYLYYDAVNGDTVRADAVKTLPSAAGEVYLGSATCDGSSCTSVDVSEAEVLSSASVLASSIAALEAAVGIPYSLSDDLQTIVAALLAGATASTDPISWGTLTKTYGVDPTTVIQQIAADLLQHVTDYHTASAGDGDEEVTLLFERWNVEATNWGRSLLIIARTLNPQIFTYLVDVAWVVWGVTGEGSDSYDFVDWTNSTWVVTP